MDGFQEYQKINNENKRIMKELEGKVLKEIRVHVVDPEYNIVFLIFESMVYAIHGRVGSEILGIYRIDKVENSYLNESKYECLYEIFQGHVISQVRIIGDVWNGYGFELSFEGIKDKTILIQSIYAGDKPEGYDDCLRLGIGFYSYHKVDSIVGYSNSVDTLLKRFPELEKQIKEEIEFNGEVLPHIIFGNVFNPYVIELLKENNAKEKLKKIFQFMEELACGKDEKVKELLTLTILARIGDEKDVLKKAYEYMSLSTRKFSDEIEKFMGRIEDER